MAEARKNAGNVRRVDDSSDVYTAVLGLALLTLLGTIGWVCYSGWQMYGSIFTIVKM